VVLSVVMESSRIYSPLLEGGTPEPICLMKILTHEALVNSGRRLSLTTEGWKEVPQGHNQTDKQYKMPYGCESKRANPASNDGLGSEGDCNVKAPRKFAR